MGHVLAILTKFGVDNIGYELIEDQLSYKNKRQHETSAADAITEWVKTNPTFAMGEATAHFKAEGRTPGAVYTAIATLVKNGVLKRLSPKNYAVASMKAIEPPKAKAKTKAAKKEATPAQKRTRSPSLTKDDAKKFSVSGIDAIRNYMRPRKSITTQAVQEFFRNQGRNPKSVSPIVFKLQTLGELKRSDTAGEYIVIKKKADAMNSAVVETETHNNVEQAHG
jgi:hypothetical protein